MGDIILTVVPVVSTNKPNKARFECRVNLSFKTEMLCNFLTFVAPCFLLLDKEPGEKCISQCHSLGRELPSFNTVQKFINVIRQLEKPSGADQTFALTTSKEPSKIKVRFPIAVKYDFERDTWVDSHSRESVNELPWALGYPHLNNVLVLGTISTNSKGITNTI